MKNNTENDMEDAINNTEFIAHLMRGNIKINMYYVPSQISDVLFPDIYNEGIRLQKIFNFYDPESELSLLNKKRKLKVSMELLEVINKALEYCKETNGLYDISLGKNFLERKSKKQLTKLTCSYKDIKINGTEISLENNDAMVDLGSIAKGYIVDRLADFLNDKGIESFSIDARGDIFFYGEDTHVIGVQHPRDINKVICRIKLKDEGVATSGDYNQFYESFDKSHILNQKDVISVTVVSEKVEDADIFATALFVSNNEERQKLIKEHNNMKILIITKDIKLEMYNGFKDIVYGEK